MTLAQLSYSAPQPDHSSLTHSSGPQEVARSSQASIPVTCPSMRCNQMRPGGLLSTTLGSMIVTITKSMAGRVCVAVGGAPAAPAWQLNTLLLLLLLPLRTCAPAPPAAAPQQLQKPHLPSQQKLRSWQSCDLPACNLWACSAHMPDNRAAGSQRCTSKYLHTLLL